MTRISLRILPVSGKREPEDRITQSWSYLFISFICLKQNVLRFLLYFVLLFFIQGPILPDIIYHYRPLQRNSFRVNSTFYFQLSLLSSRPICFKVRLSSRFYIVSFPQVDRDTFLVPGTYYGQTEMNCDIKLFVDLYEKVPINLIHSHKHLGRSMGVKLLMFMVFCTIGRCIPISLNSIILFFKSESHRDRDNFTNFPCTQDIDNITCHVYLSETKWLL